MEIKVIKYTNEEALRLANSFTSGKESHMTLATAYRYGHSTIRTQRFYVLLKDTPLFVASQLVRSHVGVQWYQRSKRTDRDGENFSAVCDDIADTLLELDFDTTYDIEERRGVQNSVDADIRSLPERFDRYAPTDLMGDLNAETLINLAHKRLCNKASKETREVMTAICNEVLKVDPDLFVHLVPQCIHCGYCPEPKGCHYIDSEIGKVDRQTYLDLFKQK